MVFTFSSTHSDGKPLPMRLLEPYARTEEICPAVERMPRCVPPRALNPIFAVAPAADARS